MLVQTNKNFNMNEIDIARQLILTEYDTKKGDYEKFAKKMSILIEDILSENEVKLSIVKFRIKDKESLHEKIERKALNLPNSKLYQSIEEITDICGIRIILVNEQDIDKVVDLIYSEFVVDEENSEDKRIKEFDRFGYLSYHQVVYLNDTRSKCAEYKRFKKIKFEIQIRTLLQHAWAEIEHELGYKAKRNLLPSRIKRHLSMLSATLELVDKGFVEIEKDSQSKSVNKPTLVEFVNKNKVIRSLDRFIVNNTQHSIDSSKYDFGFIMKNLIFVQLSDIKQIEIALDTYQDEIELFILQFKHRKKINFENNGFCLIFLSIFLAKEKFSSEQFMQYLQDVELDDYTSIEHFYEQLTNSYKRVKLIKKFNLKGRI